jgi:pilus assembly protein CpaC
MKTGVLTLALVLFSLVMSGHQGACAANKVYRLTEAAKVRNISVVINTTDVLMFEEVIGSYAVGDPEIADVLPIRGKEAYLQGRKLGITNLTVMSPDGVRRAVFNIEVTMNTSAIMRTIKRVEPTASVSIATNNGRVILTGNVPNASAAARILEIVSQFVDTPGDVINAMTIADAQQVMLEVRFLEVNRSIGKEVGVDWLVRSPDVVAKSGNSGILDGLLDSASVIGSSSFAAVLAQFTVGAVNVDVAIRALEAKGVTRRLAEPNLVALSGQQATFLAGGEIPYLVAQDNGTNTTEFKKYGVQLTFTPTVLRDDVINLKLVPEFSQPDPSSISEEGEPALLTRRAETMVELRDGQTFVIAGLLDGFNQRNVDQVPGIGGIPVLGALFRSADFRKRETELIIVVTPRIVKPLTPGARLNTPLDTMKSSTEAELFLKGELERKPARKTAPAPKHGTTGHILDIGG